MRIHDIAYYFAIFFLAGVALASLGAKILFAVIIVAVLGGIFWFKKKLPLALLSIAIIAGFLYFNLYYEAKGENIPFGEAVTFTGVVVKHPESRLKSQRLDIRLQSPYAGEVSAYTQVYPKYEYGDLLEFSGTINKSPSGRLNIVSFPEITFIESGHGSKFKQFLFSIKDRLVYNLEAILPPEKSALISGILFGERAEFSDEFKEAMNKSGTTHIVALSGYNISIIAQLVAGSLAYFLSRRKSFYISVLFIIAFVLMTGAEASVVRAAIMGIILMLAERNSRIHSFRNAITLTALGMVLFDPRILVYDVGFQLSFMALLGIVYLESPVKKFLRLKDEPGFLGWRGNLSKTVSAQIGVLPILIFIFGYFSPFSVIANVLILSFIPATMFFGIIAAAIGLVSLKLSILVGLLLSALLAYEIFIINFFSFNWL